MKRFIATLISILIMIGGEISGNSATYGGGVYVVYGGTFTVGGTAVISGNTLSGSTTKSNVYLPGGITIPLSSPESGMNIGVTLASNYGDNAFATSGADATIAGYFFSDDTTKEVALDGDALKLAEISGTLGKILLYTRSTDETRTLSGGAFTLTKSESGDNVSYTTDANGKLTFTLVSSYDGTYTLTETTAPSGYETAENLTLHISEETSCCRSEAPASRSSKNSASHRP